MTLCPRTPLNMALILIGGKARSAKVLIRKSSSFLHSYFCFFEHSRSHQKIKSIKTLHFYVTNSELTFKSSSYNTTHQLQIVACHQLNSSSCHTFHKWPLFLCDSSPYAQSTCENILCYTRSIAQGGAVTRSECGLHAKSG